MVDPQGPYRVGGFFMALGGVVLLSAPLFGGDAWISGAGVVFLLVAFGLFSNLRGVAYVAFLGAMIGGIVALGAVWSASLPAWWAMLVCAICWLAAGALFVVLWRPSPR